MVVDLPGLPLTVFLGSKAVHVSVEQDKDEGEEQVKDEPNINHLDIGGGRQAATDADEHRRQHKHGGQIHSHNRFKEKILEKK